jgi:hypothetical protein
MKMPTNLKEVVEELAITFRNLVGGPLPKVFFLGHDEHGRPTVLVGYYGDHLVRCVQLEAFVIEHGDVIHQRSKQANGVSFFIYCITKK